MLGHSILQIQVCHDNQRWFYHIFFLGRSRDYLAIPSSGCGFVYILYHPVYFHEYFKISCLFDYHFKTYFPFNCYFNCPYHYYFETYCPFHCYLKTYRSFHRTYYITSLDCVTLRRYIAVLDYIALLGNITLLYITWPYYLTTLHYLTALHYFTTLHYLTPLHCFTA